MNYHANSLRDNRINYKGTSVSCLTTKAFPIVGAEAGRGGLRYVCSGWDD